MKKYLAAAFIFPLIAGSGVLYLPGTEVLIAGDGKSDYVIVLPENCDFKVKSAASKLSREIKKATGADIPVVTDSTPPAGGPYKPCEILIGDTSREGSALSCKGLLYSDYAVKVYDKTLSVSAVNSDVYSQAVDYIVDNLVSDGVFSVKKEFRYTHRANYEIDSLVLCGKDISEYTFVAESPVFSEYADGLVQTLLQKTGKAPSVDEKTSADRSEIIFTYGNDLSPMQYSIKSSDGDILVCAPSALAKSEVCGKLDEILFSGGNTVNKESLDVTGEVAPTNEYEKFITVRGSLSNTLSKLTDKGELTVAYFGGSVTVGHGATDLNKYSWRALTTKWLKENFPRATITEVNAAIGATGSHLGAFRTERDIISQKPDLLFVEFSVNDSYNGETADSAAENYEAIVRRVRKALPECDIVNVYITDSGKTSSGGNYIQKKAHESVAEAYGISAVDVGRALAVTKKLSGNTDDKWKVYFKDIVHNTDAGYAEYSKVISEYLSNELIFAKSQGVAKHGLPECVNAGADKELNYQLITREMAEQYTGAEFKEGTVFDKLSHTPYNSYVSLSQGNKITVTFTGTELALLMSDYTSGTIKYTVDGKSGSAVRNSMNNPFPLIKGLEYGEHTAEIEVCFDKDSKSARLVGFLSR